MSHTTTIKTVSIRDIDALRQTITQLNAAGVRCELQTNTVPRMFYRDQHGTCDYVIKLHDSPYDVGLEKQNDGSYVPVFDEWRGHIGSQLGASCPMPDTPEGKAQHAIGRLMQGYAVNASINAATAQGYNVVGHSTDAYGSVHLEIEV